MPYTVSWAAVGEGLELPYVEAGDPGGVPTVLLHGYADTWRSFECLLPELPSSARAFAFSQRGHGGPRTEAAEYSLGALAEDVASFMDYVGVERGFVVGSSSGGYIAQRLAADHPERVSGLVLVGAPRSLRRNQAVERFAAELRGRDRLDASFVRDFIVSTLHRPISEAFLRTMISESQAIPADVWRDTLAALTEARVPTESGTITAPTLILWGERDAFVSRADTDTLAGAIQQSTLTVYEDAGHALLWEEPRGVAADLAAFLDRHGSG